MPNSASPARDSRVGPKPPPQCPRPASQRARLHELKQPAGLQIQVSGNSTGRSSDAICRVVPAACIACQMAKPWYCDRIQPGTEARNRAHLHCEFYVCGVAVASWRWLLAKYPVSHPVSPHAKAAFNITRVTCMCTTCASVHLQGTHDSSCLHDDIWCGQPPCLCCEARCHRQAPSDIGLARSVAAGPQ